MQFLFDSRNEFDPDRVSRISSAFHAALHGLTEDDCTELPAHAIRRLIASGIIAAAKAGENDLERLTRAGLQALHQPVDAASLDWTGQPAREMRDGAPHR